MNSEMNTQNNAANLPKAQSETSSNPCCSKEKKETCCEPQDKAECCGTPEAPRSGGCGCS